MLVSLLSTKWPLHIFRKCSSKPVLSFCRNTLTLCFIPSRSFYQILTHMIVWIHNFCLVMQRFISWSITVGYLVNKIKFEKCQTSNRPPFCTDDFTIVFHQNRIYQPNFLSQYFLNKFTLLQNPWTFHPFTNIWLHACIIGFTCTKYSHIWAVAFIDHNINNLDICRCLPMNFDKDDLAGSIVLRDRQRIGASLADIDPMNIDRSVSGLVVLFHCFNLAYWLTVNPSIHFALLYAGEQRIIFFSSA